MAVVILSVAHLYNVAPELIAWGTTVKAGNVGDDPYVVERVLLPATLSIGSGGQGVGELARSQQLCTFITATGSGFGVCPPAAWSAWAAVACKRCRSTSKPVA